MMAMEDLRREIDEYASFLRQVLDLQGLTPAQRRAHRRRWSPGAREVVRRALRAAARARRPGDGSAAPSMKGTGTGPGPGADELRAQRERVRLLERVYLHLARLTREAADTLLRERVALYEMSMTLTPARIGSGGAEDRHAHLTGGGSRLLLSDRQPASAFTRRGRKSRDVPSR